jgi:hypothetical protein
MQVPETKNSADLFALLNARRGLPPQPPKAPSAGERAIDAWAPSNLAKGLGQVGRWLGLALRAAVLDRRAYREVVRDPLMTGPAVLILLVASALATFGVAQSLALTEWPARLASALVAPLLVFVAGRVLGRKGEFTTTLRAVGFANSIYVLGLLALIPALAPVVRIGVSVVALFAVWMGAAEAHDLRGWRSLVFPVAFLAATVVGALALAGLAGGLQITLSSLEQMRGLSQ